MNDKTNTQAQQSGDGFSLSEWEASNPQAFDRYAMYMEHAAPLLEKLREVCQEHRLPFMFVVGHTQFRDGNTAVAIGSHFPSASEAMGEIIAANFSARTEPMAAMQVCRSDFARTDRLQSVSGGSSTKH